MFLRAHSRADNPSQEKNERRLNWEWKVSFSACCVNCGIIHAELFRQFYAVWNFFATSKRRRQTREIWAQLDMTLLLLCCRSIYPILLGFLALMGGKKIMMKGKKRIYNHTKVEKLKIFWTSEDSNLFHHRKVFTLISHPAALHFLHLSSF